MAQKFAKNDANEDKFIAVWEAMIDRTFIELNSYYENVDRSPALGNAIWEAQAVDVWKILEQNLFVRVFDSLIKAGYKNGSVDSYCRVIYALFGSTTDIDIIINAPLDITINITAEYENLSMWLTKSGEIMLTRQGDILMFKTLLSDISQAQLELIFRSITNAGTRINFNLL